MDMCCFFIFIPFDFIALILCTVHWICTVLLDSQWLWVSAPIWARLIAFNRCNCLNFFSLFAFIVCAHSRQLAFFPIFPTELHSRLQDLYFYLQNFYYIFYFNGKIFTKCSNIKLSWTFLFISRLLCSYDVIVSSLNPDCTRNDVNDSTILGDNCQSIVQNCFDVMRSLGDDFVWGHFTFVSNELRKTAKNKKCDNTKSDPLTVVYHHDFGLTQW